VQIIQKKLNYRLSLKGGITLNKWLINEFIKNLQIVKKLNEESQKSKESNGTKDNGNKK